MLMFPGDGKSSILADDVMGVSKSSGLSELGRIILDRHKG